MNLRRLLAEAIAIQSIPSPTFKEAQRAQYMFRAFNELALSDVEVDEIGNVYGRLPGGDTSPLIITAHMDTVFPEDTPLSHTLGEDRIFGPGIGDNSIALAVLLEVARDLVEHDLQADIWLVANVGEEGLGNLRGMNQIVDRFGGSVTGYLVLEGMALGHIYNEALPVRRFRITTTAPGGHAWIHHERPSAIHVACRIGHQLTTILLPADPKSILNIGWIEGGTSINSVARQAVMEIDIRSESPAVLDRLEAELRMICDQQNIEPVQVVVEEIGRRPAGGLPDDHPLVQAAVRALLQVGIDEYSLETGSTDANIPLSRGFPAVCLGITRGGGAHSMQEFIEIGPIEQGFRALRELILALIHD